jgi:hypothetical protein
MTEHKAQRELLDIVDVFSGADGGVAFARLKSLVDELAEQASAGDADAGAVLAVVSRFHRLISAAQRYATKDGRT